MKYIMCSRVFPKGHPKEGQPTEEWKPIIGYEGVYEISNLGRFKSIERRCEIAHGTRLVPEKYLAPGKSSNGYLTIGLNSGRKKTYQIHKLVFVHFGNEKLIPGMNINHIDGVKTNNCIWNLEQVTPSENRKHAFRIGLQKKPFGENNPQSKLSNKDVELMKNMMADGKKDYDLAVKFGLSKKYINEIRNGKSRNPN